MKRRITLSKDRDKEGIQQQEWKIKSIQLKEAKATKAFVAAGVNGKAWTSKENKRLLRLPSKESTLSLTKEKKTEAKQQVHGTTKLLLLPFQNSEAKTQIDGFQSYLLFFNALFILFEGQN